MPRKKKIFRKDNICEKLLLVPGNPNAVNADGKTLPNELVPLPKNYKQGSSLFMPNISALSFAEPPEEGQEELDLKRMIVGFNDPDTEVVIEDLPSKVKQLGVSKRSKEFKFFEDKDEKEDLDDFFDGQFSNADDEGSESSDYDDTVDHPNCPEALKTFNAIFNNKIAKEYNDDQIGALDHEFIQGYLSPSSDRYADFVYSKSNEEEDEIVIGNYEKAIKEKILQYAEDSGEEKIVKIVIEKPLEFDCESILSTYSNKYNHPTVIKEERIKKIKIPNNPLKKRLTKSQLKSLENEKESDDESDDNVTVSTAFNLRVKNETPEQRRERKHLFKEAKRESRILKKENKLAFKREKKIQNSQSINVQRNAGIKLL